MYVPQLRLRDCIAINLHICYVSAAMTSASAIADTQAPSNYPGGTLRDLVRAQGRRQNWIAARLGISNGLLNLTVVGGRPISPAIAGGLAGILGVPVEDVIDFLNANLTTGFADVAPETPPATEPAAKQGGGLLDRLRGR